MLALAAGLTSAAQAQVSVFRGTSPNTTTTLDFDTPAAPLGPIAGTAPTFTAAGISSVTVIGAWVPGADTLTNGSNVNGASLVVQGGGLVVGITGDALDAPAAGDGFEFALAAPVDEFGLLFSDQLNFNYDVELLLGGVSLGTEFAAYGGAGFPAEPVYFRGPSAFDGVRITFPLGTGGVGVDEITLGNGMGPMIPPLPPNCVETSFYGGNGGGLDGVVYFDLTANINISIASILTHYNAVAGTTVSMDVYTTPGTAFGAEQDPTVWTLAASGDGTGVSAGFGEPTAIDFVNPLILAPGSYGIALAAIGSAHAYTNGVPGTGTETAADGSFSIQLGTAQNALFTGAPFSPRLWNGRLCADPSSPGMNYCMANANSTTAVATMSGSGSTSFGANDLVIAGSNLPVNSFSFFITSRMQGFVANPNGSQGNLCVLGAIGRYVGPGQIQQANGAGEISLPINWMTMPQPTGIVSANVGEMWNFQAWYRDSVGGMPTSNFTDGLAVTVTM